MSNPNANDEDIDLEDFVFPPLEAKKRVPYVAIRIKEGETREDILRRLAMGERADQMKPIAKPTTAGIGFNACLAHVRGDR